MDIQTNNSFSLDAAAFSCHSHSSEFLSLHLLLENQKRIKERDAIFPMRNLAKISQHLLEDRLSLATHLTTELVTAHQHAGQSSRVQSLLQQYSLSSHEGVALMCLAEALLRIPDVKTRDLLIRDKIGEGQWGQYLGKSTSLFVNAATWGLVVTGKLVNTHNETGLTSALKHVLARGGEPLIRKGVAVAMGMLGEQFVLGETIDEALNRAVALEKQGFTYSYDMLGEAAITGDMAQFYYKAYLNSILAIGQRAKGDGVAMRPGISIKLSALYPKYNRAHIEGVLRELLPRLFVLVLEAKKYNIGINIDAEESDRLDLSLLLLEKICEREELKGWDGIGFVIQAYQKRCPAVIDLLVAIAQKTNHRLMVRLVKGAYWDSEIKRAQIDGQMDYPVYTRKCHTDVSYIACARKLLSQPSLIYPQFATHNAFTVATIVCLAKEIHGAYDCKQYEFQCLHGMGEVLYGLLNKEGESARPCRIYAPVGTHETLLAYLVRRLLENGANTSFVHRLNDGNLQLSELLRDPVEQMMVDAQEVDEALGYPHPRIPLPTNLYGSARRNSKMPDLSHEPTLSQLTQTMNQAISSAGIKKVYSLLATSSSGQAMGASQPGEAIALYNPSWLQEQIGLATLATEHEVEDALASAVLFEPIWANVTARDRAEILEKAADLLAENQDVLMATLIKEAGKAWPHASNEVREAIDFLRYYAAQIKARFENETHQALGLVVCISPWNFPLAIFIGQVAAALASGNVVIAKPSENTNIIAFEAVSLLWKAGVPKAALQLVLGTGNSVGTQLVADQRIQAVVFTGSTQTARAINQTLSKRLDKRGNPVTLIAETGGQNAMIVDSSALLEQVTQDCIASAFEAAGQRCSALRVLCVQDDIADELISMIKGAMAQIRLGNPVNLHVDMGAVIDARAQAALNAHMDAMRVTLHRIYRAHDENDQRLRLGHFFLPTLIEIKNLDELQQEVFGPVLHILRYPANRMDEMIDAINATGYALTFGIHSRIDETIQRVMRKIKAGNVYVNRTTVGAVVGVQPFGGEGLSGTGPKAGGPLYLYRLLSMAPPSDFECMAAELNANTLLGEKESQSWRAELKGPTGESNLYEVSPREAVFCFAQNGKDGYELVLAAQEAGCKAIFPESQRQELEALLTKNGKQLGLGDVLSFYQDLAAFKKEHMVQTALVNGRDESYVRQVVQLLADQTVGAIVSVLRVGGNAQPATFTPILKRERTFCINTTASGGNASLIMLE